jgi:hypothetical protein
MCPDPHLSQSLLTYTAVPSPTITTNACLSRSSPISHNRRDLPTYLLTNLRPPQNSSLIPHPQHLPTYLAPNPSHTQPCHHILFPRIPIVPYTYPTTRPLPPSPSLICLASHRPAHNPPTHNPPLHAQNPSTKIKSRTNKQTRETDREMNVRTKYKTIRPISKHPQRPREDNQIGIPAGGVDGGETEFVGEADEP